MRSAFAVAGLVAVVAAEVYTVTQTEDVTITSCAPTVANCPAKATSSADGEEAEWGAWSSAATTTTTSADPTWAEWSSSTTTTTSADPSWAEWSSSSTSSYGDKKTSSTSSTASTTESASWAPWSSTTVATTTSSAKTTGSAACPTYTATGVPDWFSMLPSSVLSSVAAKWTGGPPADWCYYTYSTSSIKTSATPYYPTGATTTGPSGTGTGVWANWSASSTVTGGISKYTGAANVNSGSIAMAGLAAAAALVMA